jgi:5'(3')-deoxyribonucleotidase
LKHKIEPVIYLDLDGVCVDFVNASIQANGFDPDEIARKWSRDFKGEYRVWEVLGILREDYWDTIALQGEDFWRDLEAYDWYDQLYGGLCEIAPVIFLSSSTRTPSCLSGKLHWLQDRFGVTFRDFIFTGQKQQLASPAALLVDDYGSNVESFRGAGGHAILFPQVWNQNNHVEDKLSYTLKEARDWYSWFILKPR